MYCMHELHCKHKYISSCVHTFIDKLLFSSAVCYWHLQCSVWGLQGSAREQRTQEVLYWLLQWHQEPSKVCLLIAASCKWCPFSIYSSLMCSELIPASTGLISPLTPPLKSSMRNFELQLRKEARLGSSELLDSVVPPMQCFPVCVCAQLCPTSVCKTRRFLKRTAVIYCKIIINFMHVL